MSSRVPGSLQRDLRLIINLIRLQIKVIGGSGDYGEIDNDTGELDVEGNIYDKSFQTLLNEQGLKINFSNSSYQPKKGAVDDNMIMSFLNLASASVKTEFQFQEGKRGAVLVMHKPRQEYIPWANTFTCPGYYLYLSNKFGEKVGLALVTNVPIPAAMGVSAGGEASMDWWTDTQAAFLRKAFDKVGQYRYTPLYGLKYRNNGWWLDCMPPWQPLDENGVEDPVVGKEYEDFARRSAVEGRFPFA
ncbi:hypothetical protein DFH29DRAFT_951538 [Suillus ampliporus]|nr:hypothetical protein DFH29DRAFT_951538 [Suillus ampliporus]